MQPPVSAYRRSGRSAALRTLLAVTAEKHGTRAQLDIKD